MTVEKALYVILSSDLAKELGELQERTDAALRRVAKLPPGDTTELARYEALSTQIERKALSHAALFPNLTVFGEALPRVSRTVLTADNLSGRAHGVPQSICELLDQGRSIAVVARPLLPGDTVFVAEGSGPRPPAESWRATRFGKRNAETERFEAMIDSALAGRGAKSAINPLSVSNRVLTETLRRYVQNEAGINRIDIPVEYRDGSVADPFPLRAVRLGQSPPPGWPVLKFTLLSIRHVDWDHVVDGAWFRNSRISRSSPAGLIDADAFQISERQLAKIREAGPSVIEMYQTGFQPPVTGFYRAVVHALINHPGTLCVIPKFFVGEGFDRGEPWLTA